MAFAGKYALSVKGSPHGKAQEVGFPHGKDPERMFRSFLSCVGGSDSFLFVSEQNYLSAC